MIMKKKRVSILVYVVKYDKSMLYLNNLYISFAVVK